MVGGCGIGNLAYRTVQEGLGVAAQAQEQLPRQLLGAEAGRLGHREITPAHYLLAMIRKGDGLGLVAALAASALVAGAVVALVLMVSRRRTV